MNIWTPPPHSEEIEKSIIGAFISYPEDDFSEVVPEDFYNPANHIVFETLQNMKEEWKTIDLVSLFDEIKPTGIDAKQVAGYLEWEFTSMWLPTYVEKLKEYRRQREVLKLANELWHFFKWSPSDIMSYSDKLATIASIGSSKTASVTYDDVTRAYEQVVSRFGKDLYGYSWGNELSFLDEITKWIVKKRVYRVWATSNTWKTQLIYNLIPKLLEQKNEDWSDVKVAFFALENTKEDTLVSLMCNHSWLNAFEVNKGIIEWEWDYLTTLEWKLFVIDDKYDLDEIFSTCLAIKPDVVILDYVTHVSVAKTQWLEAYDEYAKRVPKFAKRNNIAWIDLNNLPKNLQTSEEIRATPWFYGSSLLMNNCDVAIHIMKNAQFVKAKAAVFQNMKSSLDDKKYFLSRASNDLLITKNRWWSVFVERTYWINFNTWWRWKELNESDINTLWAKYG